MDVKAFDQLLAETQAKQTLTLAGKRSDYANENIDVLDNFNNGAAIIGITPEQHCMVLMATKLARLGNLLSNNKTPKNESVIDSIDDLGNYCVLLKAIVIDKKHQNTTKEKD